MFFVTPYLGSALVALLGAVVWIDTMTYNAGPSSTPVMLVQASGDLSNESLLDESVVTLIAPIAEVTTKPPPLLDDNAEAPVNATVVTKPSDNNGTENSLDASVVTLITPSLEATTKPPSHATHQTTKPPLLMAPVVTTVATKPSDNNGTENLPQDESVVTLIAPIVEVTTKPPNHPTYQTTKPPSSFDVNTEAPASTTVVTKPSDNNGTEHSQDESVVTQVAPIVEETTKPPNHPTYQTTKPPSSFDVNTEAPASTTVVTKPSDNNGTENLLDESGETPIVPPNHIAHQTTEPLPLLDDNAPVDTTVVKKPDNDGTDKFLALLQESVDMTQRCYSSPPDPAARISNCAGNISDYKTGPDVYFDATSGECIDIRYHECMGEGIRNGFLKKKECRKWCLPILAELRSGQGDQGNGLYSVVNDYCNLAVDAGPGHQYLPRFHYSPFYGKCIRFVYGGEGGNENNFYTMQQCMRACMISS